MIKHTYDELPEDSYYWQLQLPKSIEAYLGTYKEHKKKLTTDNSGMYVDIWSRIICLSLLRFCCVRCLVCHRPSPSPGVVVVCWRVETLECGWSCVSCLLLFISSINSDIVSHIITMIVRSVIVIITFISANLCSIQDSGKCQKCFKVISKVRMENSSDYSL